MKSILTAAVLSVALLAAPASQAASYQDRTTATGAVVGAATGAAVGAGSNQVVEGAIFGAVLGTVAGAIIGSQHQPVHVVEHRSHRQYKPARYERERRHSYKRPHYRQARHKVERRHTYSRSNDRGRYDSRRGRSYDRRDRH